MPVGGDGVSGYGWFRGKAAIWITIEDPNQHYPF